MARNSFLDDLEGYLMTGLAFLLTLFLLPGMMLMALVQDMLGKSLDSGQMWTFAFLLSAGLLALLIGVKKDLGKALGLHALISLGVVAFTLIAAFGFHAAFPAVYLGFFLGS